MTEKPSLMAAPAQRYYENWQEEVDSAAQYRALAELENKSSLSSVYAGLAKVEETHAGFWEAQMRKAGLKVPARKPSWRSRILIAIARRFGPALVLSTIAANETVGRNNYSVQPESAPTPMSEQERSHSRILQRLVATQRHGVEGGFLGRIEGRHRSVGGNALRAAVLGANDGLCSNLSLVMGVVGASVSAHAVVLTGVAGLLAGAFSMALGEWVSVKSSRELAEREIRIEENELSSDPEGEGEELKLIYEAKGLSGEEADSMVAHLLKDKTAALDTLSREELGIDPNDLGGSPGQAAGSSFALFSVGALVPLFPFFFWDGRIAIALSIAASALALFGVGAIITLFTGRSAWATGLRQLFLGIFAALATFLIGRLLGGGLR